MARKPARKASEPTGREQTSPQDGVQVAGAAAGTVAPAAADQNAAQKTVPTVVVKGPKRGRWRAGRHFGPEAVSIQRDELEDEELAALEADPALIVSVIDAPY